MTVQIHWAIAGLVFVGGVALGLAVWTVMARLQRQAAGRLDTWELVKKDRRKQNRRNAAE